MLLLLPMPALVLWQVLGPASQRELDVRSQGVQQQVQAAAGVLAGPGRKEPPASSPTEQAQVTAKTVKAAAPSAMAATCGSTTWVRATVMPGEARTQRHRRLEAIKQPVHGLRRHGSKRQKAGRGHQWSRPGGDKPVDKVSMRDGLRAWGWIVGGGIYVDDTHNASLHDACSAAVVLLLAIVLGGYASPCRW
ncbi:MAG: cache domain-containing protein [Ideonella sp.]|nr:cache domain-containing protein [Ideonella sp.]